MADDRIYKIEYGRSVYYKSRTKDDVHTTRPLNRSEAEKRLKELNKQWDYTTLFKLIEGKWLVQG